MCMPSEEFLAITALRESQRDLEEAQRAERRAQRDLVAEKGGLDSLLEEVTVATEQIGQAERYVKSTRMDRIAAEERLAKAQVAYDQAQQREAAKFRHPVMRSTFGS